ncbi:methyltransferase domain-containing protein [Mesorhizobium sp. B3-1-9]|uniref:class I SAM-dependent methyltransferase n=1 Tax=Mesorhizobium sp. B3-1-9 TaxID=2589892 RepID=UPI001127050A|nr:methyltransferase domain-containing protein [Mesorhizobium sp. B3-1-9]TPI38614.1 methyltransferase domain-containing protein [Mesorhizobium sp. B3-1-9]
MSDVDYALGHAEAELRRLVTQARLIDPITRRFLEAAGIAKGMRILDIGSGAGDVAFLCGELVGPTGEVVGTDLALVAVEQAELRAKNAGSDRIAFRHGDPAEMKFDEPFDAIVGRYVLQFMPDPAQSLRRIVRHLRTGGIVIFHELDWDGARSSPPSPTYDQVCGLLSSTIERAGAQVRLGARLARVFEDAGLPAPTLRLEAVIASGRRTVDVVHLVTDLVETQLPTMERLGIVTASQIEPSVLAERILSEIGKDGTLMGRSEIGAWTATPA